MWQSEKSRRQIEQPVVRVTTKKTIKKNRSSSNDESRLDSLIQRLVRRWLAEQETSLSANRIEQFVAWVGADAERWLRDNWRSWPGRPSG